MASKLGVDSERPKVSVESSYALQGRAEFSCRRCCSLASLKQDDYTGLMELAAAMNSRYSDRREVQLIAQDVLRE
jgi:hypothetical protein